MIFAHHWRAEVHQTDLKDKIKVSCYMYIELPGFNGLQTATRSAKSDLWQLLHHEVLHTVVSSAFPGLLKSWAEGSSLFLVSKCLKVRSIQKLAQVIIHKRRITFSCSNHCLSKYQASRTEYISHFTAFILYMFWGGGGGFICFVLFFGGFFWFCFF